MLRKLIGSIFVAALLMQGWVQSAAAMPVDSAPVVHCAGEAFGGADPGCCPDGETSAGDCQTHCGLGAAITVELTAFASARGAPPQRQLTPGREGPAYLPPNPPPNA